MKTPITVRASTPAAVTPSQSPGQPRPSLRFWALMAAMMGLNAALLAAPVTIPDFSFEQTDFPQVTNVLSPGGTGAVFNNAQLTPVYYWWGAGFTSATITNGNGAFLYPLEYVQNDNTTNGAASLFPTNSDDTMIAPGDGTNYLVVGGTGDQDVWQPIGPLLSNTVYTLTVAVGLDLANGYLPADGSSGYGGGTALVALVSGNEIYDIFTPGAIIASMQVENTNYTPGTWVDNVLVFTNGYQTSGGLTILVRGLSGFSVDFDNFRLDATPLSFTAVVPTVTTDIGTSATNVNQGTLVTLNENPVGVAPFTYGWRTDNGSHGATWTPIAGANGTNYVVNTAGISPTTPVGFDVIVTNGASVSTSAPVTLSTMTNAPVLVRDTLPSSGSFDVVGSTLTLSAVFDGSRPITYQWQFNGANLPGATNETLTLNLTDTNQSGAYSLVASNAFGTNTSTPETNYVNALPAANGNIILSTAMEWGSFFNTLGYDGVFNPTFTLATNSLIAGLEPTASIGIFTDSGCGGLPVLTDGSFAGISPPDNGSICFATAGVGNTTNGLGYSITYTLPPSTTGWTITNITSYGGWADSGREEQSYQVSYSSPLAPTNFSGVLPWTAFTPPNPPSVDNGGGVATATKMSLIPANGVLAQNVAAVQFYFSSEAAGQSPKNGWEGYAQFQVFGYKSTNLPPAITQSILPASGSDVVGSQVTIEAAFSSLEAISYTWLKDGVPIAGQTNSALTLVNLQLSDTSTNPGYVLQASNSLGVAESGPCSFVVNPAPTADGNNIIFYEANQCALGGLLSPTWVLASNSLLTGLLPYAYTGNISDGTAGPSVLTDGQFGTVGEGNDNSAISAGNSGGAQTIYYTLPASSNGWNITGIASYGGWSDTGRNEQEYAVYYAVSGDPYNFILLDQSPAYQPPVPSAEPNATRMIWGSGAAAPLATNVVAVEFDFNVTPNVENGWEGYNELQIFGTNATTREAPQPQAPIVVTDITPGYGSDVAGSSVTFTASFSGSAPISYQWQFNSTNLPGATDETLTLNDLNTNMTGSYNLLATNIDGSTSTSIAQFTVNPVPTATNGIIYSFATQIVGDFNGGLGLAPDEFTPTWTIAPGSLIAGKLPSTVGPGNFQNQGGSGEISVLTDGVIGLLVSDNEGSISNYVDCGTVGSGAGQFVTYTLGGSPGGYTLNSIVSYGGWPDYGRDWQYYTVSYSTVTSPTTFVPLGQATFQLPNLRPGGAPNAGRVTWTAAGGVPLATGVAAVEFNFTTPAGQENGWQGYSELQLFGTPSITAPTITSSTISGGNLVLTGSGGKAGAAYAWLTTTNLAIPLSAWTTNVTGTFDSSGDFSNSISINISEPGRFFRLSTP